MSKQAHGGFVLHNNSLIYFLCVRYDKYAEKNHEE